MSQSFCPKCGGSGVVLLNLVSCVTPNCKNYDAKWAQEWQNNNSPRFQHNFLLGTQHRCLGRFDQAVGGSQSIPSSIVRCDLYCYRSINGDSVCLARFANGDDQCFYVDEKETEIGNLISGPTKIITLVVTTALKEALKRFRRK